MLSKLNVANIVERAAWTFVQTALAIVVAAGTDYVNVATWKGAVIGAGAAALSALKNGIKDVNTA